MISFDNRFVKKLPADQEQQNFVRQVYSACYSICEPSVMNNATDNQAKTVIVNKELGKELGFDSDFLNSAGFAEVFSGRKLLDGMQTYAMCYGGHQFGNWAGQLGDGRAINLGELKTAQGNQTLQLKGAGVTPYSRHADGLAVLRSSIREYLCSEAMYHLGIPTTRAFSLVLTGEHVERDMFYDGNPKLEPGAVVCRVAPSFIRFGSFEIFASRSYIATLKKLIDFCIQFDFGDSKLTNIADEQTRYIAWFQEVVNRSCALVTHWQRVGFVHGVMNTDNMSITGLTIDYGPYGWLDDYDPQWTPNTTDLPGRRYCFANQAKIVHWNLFQLAQSLLAIIDDRNAMQVILDAFPQKYEQSYQNMMAQKLGLEMVEKDLVTELETILQSEPYDMTLFYRLLAAPLAELNVEHFESASYHSEQSGSFSEASRNNSDEISNSLRFNHWLQSYKDQVTQEGHSERQRHENMNQINPCFVLRNYLSQQAITAAEKGDFSCLNDLIAAIKEPYQYQEEHVDKYQKRPTWAKNSPGCSMLSCSS